MRVNGTQGEKRQRLGGGARQRRRSCSTRWTTTAEVRAASSECRPRLATRSRTKLAQPGDGVSVANPETAKKKRTKPPRTGDKGRVTRSSPPQTTGSPSAAPLGRSASGTNRGGAHITAAAKPGALGCPVSGDTPRKEKKKSTARDRGSGTATRPDERHSDPHRCQSRLLWPCTWPALWWR